MSLKSLLGGLRQATINLLSPRRPSPQTPLAQSAGAVRETSNTSAAETPEKKKTSVSTPKHVEGSMDYRADDRVAATPVKQPPPPTTSAARLPAAPSPYRREQHAAELSPARSNRPATPRPTPPIGLPPRPAEARPSAPTSNEPEENPFLAALVESAERAKAALRARPKSRPRPEPISRTAMVERLSIHAVDRPAVTSRPVSATPTVVLIHGAGLDHRDWTFGFIDKLPTDVRVIAFDRPGFGHSGRPSIAGGLPATQARILRLAAKDFGVENAIVVGHSWGGAVAMAWALDAPETVDGVVSLAGAVMPWSFASSVEHNRRLRNAARTAMRPGGLREAALDGLSESFAPDEVPDGYVDHIATELKLMTGAAAAAAGDVATVNGALGLQVQRYHGLTRPVELIYGGSDQILSAEEQGVAALEHLSSANLHVEPGAGHMIHHTHPDLCIGAIARLLRSEASSRGRASSPPSSSSKAAS